MGILPLQAMSQQQLALAKYLTVVLVVLGGFVLVGMGKLDAPTMYKETAILVSALVVALGLSGAGTALGGAVATTAAKLSMRPPPAANDSHGFVTLRVLRDVAVAAVGMLVLVFCVRCGGGLSGQAVQDIEVGLNAAGCVIATVASDSAAGDGPLQVVEDVVAKCGVNEQQIASLLDKQAAAETTLGHAALATTYTNVSAAAKAKAAAKAAK